MNFFPTLIGSETVIPFFTDTTALIMSGSILLNFINLTLQIVLVFCWLPWKNLRLEDYSPHFNRYPHLYTSCSLKIFTSLRHFFIPLPYKILYTVYFSPNARQSIHQHHPTHQPHPIHQLPLNHYIENISFQQLTTANWKF